MQKKKKSANWKQAKPKYIIKYYKNLAQKPGLDQSPMHVIFMVDKVTLWQILLRGLRFFPVSTIPPMVYFHLSPPIDQNLQQDIKYILCYLQIHNFIITSFNP